MQYADIDTKQNSNVDQYLESDVNAMNKQLSALNLALCVSAHNVYMSEQQFYVELSLEEKQLLKFRIDTAAETTIISKKCYESLKHKPPLHKCNVPVRGLLGKPELPVGLITVHYLFNIMVKSSMSHVK